MSTTTNDSEAGWTWAAPTDEIGAALVELEADRLREGKTILTTRWDVTAGANGRVCVVVVFADGEAEAILTHAQQVRLQ